MMSLFLRMRSVSEERISRSEGETWFRRMEVAISIGWWSTVGRVGVVEGRVLRVSRRRADWWIVVCAWVRF